MKLYVICETDNYGAINELVRAFSSRKAAVAFADTLGFRQDEDSWTNSRAVYMDGDGFSLEVVETEE